MYCSCGFIAQKDINLLKYRDIIKLYKIMTYVDCIIYVKNYKIVCFARNNFFLAYTSK